MSALGIWNNRYEGGPCYAACMETFALLHLFNSATIPQLLFAGRVVIMEQVESMMKRVVSKLKKCASVSQLNQWLLRWENSNQSRICVFIRKCFRPFLKIYIVLVLLELGDRDIDRYIQQRTIIKK